MSRTCNLWSRSVSSDVPRNVSVANVGSRITFVWPFGVPWLATLAAIASVGRDPDSVHISPEPLPSLTCWQLLWSNGTLIRPHHVHCTVNSTCIRTINLSEYIIWLIFWCWWRKRARTQAVNVCAVGAQMKWNAHYSLISIDLSIFIEEKRSVLWKKQNSIGKKITFYVIEWVIQMIGFNMSIFLGTLANLLNEINSYELSDSQWWRSTTKLKTRNVSHLAFIHKWLGRLFNLLSGK